MRYPDMRVTGYKVLVKQDASEDKVGMLFVPQGSEKYPNFGTVLAVGPLVTSVKVGERVVIERKPASAISPEAQKGDEFFGLLVLPEENIIGIVE